MEGFSLYFGVFYILATIVLNTLTEKIIHSVGKW
jgi:hypothetical protein